MSENRVTRDGLRGERQGRDATFGNGVFGAGQPGGGHRKRRRRGEELAVPPADFTSYYGRPVIKAPAWAPADIAGYLFLGGLAGAGSVLAAGAAATGRPATARAMKVSSLGAITLSTAALVHDLGRPGRFHHMLRVVKPTSPMSVGSWLLAAYGPMAGAAAASDVTGLLPRAGRAATRGAALLGPGIAAYTGVLLADTAVPAWHDAHRTLPFLFAASAAAAASGMALATGPVAENGPARRAAVLGAAAELALTRAVHRRAGLAGETYGHGAAGRLLRAAKALGWAGAAGAALLGRHRAPAALSGAALLAASACTRFGVFRAGIASAHDPKYTIAPQRERLSEGAG
ncbi:NrfD/PsrC family molybdoenzyme membrane anchor subunit [Streptomyces sp. PT12]|uniref:NrfD/PsrC family molybdoenzyme membrane anchor subunit n=1 Tax=Streptomyces sp. PT12 TaxID=1510197 RepID=UPI000DE3DAD5|nr:NrfD/PsrC family molybdoenzyme membrane anchor subunit [Streptomyces sp. PT12]RBM22139.1 polysulfide reductase [Streptomyces sp. PT12]